MEVSDDNMDFDFSPRSGENKNTKRKTETDMRIFSAYIISLNEMRPLEALPPLELDRYLTQFFSVIKKHDGNEYEPASLRGMLCSVERYLRSRNYPSSVTRDVIFLNTRNMLKEKQKVLKEISKTQKKTKQDSLTASTVERLKQLYNAKEFGPYSPTAIINSLCFAFVIHLKIRKAVDHKQLLWGDIILKSNGINEYLCYEPLQGFNYIRPQLTGISQFRIYGQNTQDSSVDPVYIYKLYASKRPRTMMSPDCPFYLGIALVCNSIPPQQQWFKPCPMGVNKLSDLVRMIRDITGSLSMVPGDQFNVDHENLSNEIRETSLTETENDQSVDDTQSIGEDTPRDEAGDCNEFYSKDEEPSVTEGESDDECLTKPTVDQTAMVNVSDTGSAPNTSQTDCSRLDHVKQTITEGLESLDDSGKSEIFNWLSTLKTPIDKHDETQGEGGNFRVTFSLTPSQMQSESPFTISADVTRSKPEMINTDYVTNQDAHWDKPCDMTRNCSRDANKAPPPAHTNPNSHSRHSEDHQHKSNMRKRPLSESVSSNTKFIKDQTTRRVSADDHSGQPETRQTSGTAHDKQTLPVYPFELPKDYASLYPPWQTMDPRFALFMRHGLIAGYQNIVNNMENCSSVSKPME